MKPLRILFGCLAAIVILFVVGLGTLYFVVMHTSLPLKAVEGAIAKDGGVQIHGLTGTLASGFQIESMRFAEPGKPTSEISQVRFDYSGPWDLFLHKRLIIREFSIGKARLVFSSKEHADESSKEESQDKQSHPGGTDKGEPWGLVQIDRVRIDNLYLEDTRTGFKLDVPKLEWTGFKAQGGQVELGQLSVNSDRLDLVTLEGRTVRIGDREVAFQRLLRGTVKPAMHPSIRQPVPFEIDVRLDPPQGATLRLTAFEGGLELFSEQGESTHVQAKNLNLAAYFDASPYDLPRDLTFKADATYDVAAKRSRLKLEGGSLVLGDSRFEIQPQEVITSAEGAAGEKKPEEIVLTAVHDAAGRQITLALHVSEEKPHLRVRLTGPAGLESRQLVARVFFGKTHAKLTPAERQEVERRLRLYFQERKSADNTP